MVRLEPAQRTAPTKLPRWRPLEAALAAVGSQSEDVLDSIDDEQESGRGKPIDIEYLLANVIPSILSLSGRHSSLSECGGHD